MNLFFPSLEEKIAWYQMQAEKLRSQAQYARENQQDFVEAKRLDNLALEAENEVRNLQAQIQALV